MNIVKHTSWIALNTGLFLVFLHAQPAKPSKLVVSLLVHVFSFCCKTVWSYYKVLDSSKILNKRSWYNAATTEHI